MNFINYLLEKSCKIDKDFVLSKNEKISHKALNSKINTFAKYLYDKFGTGKEIMLLSENNLFFIISYLAIIKSGNIAVLLETRISEKDLKSILSKCSITAFFIQDKFKNKFNSNAPVFNESWLQSLAEYKDDFNIKTNDNNLAIVIFTSGSTGSKKGVMLSHKNLKVNTESIIEYLNLNEQDRAEVVLPFFYCYGASLLHTHLRVGGSLVINKGLFLSCMNEIEQFQCTGFAGVPSTYQILINETDFLQRDFPSIRYFAQAGGNLPNKYILKIADTFLKKSFFVMYGATEATARLSYLPPHHIRSKLGSIGKGMSGVKLEVLDSNDKLIKAGEVGEITATGDNIMEGYYKEPQDTKNVLKNGRLYTGDLATVDDDGYIYIVGRSSRIIKSAGYRISPLEIEEVINSIEGVSNCAVFGVSDDMSGEVVIAAVETKDANEKLKDYIISHCNTILPSYKVPQEVIFLERFPLNSSNKVDINKLEQMAIFNLNNRLIKEKQNE